MKRIIALVTSLALFATTFMFPVQAQTNDSVHSRLYNNGLTRYDSLGDFRPDDWITRGEMSKFVTKYAEFRWLQKNYNQCNFNDIGWYDSTLEPFILEACQYGLLKGSGNSFNPTGNVTEAQAITVVIRSLYWFLDETGAYRRQPYLEAGRYLDIANQWETIESVDYTNITRIKMGKWFYLAAQKTDAEIQTLDGEEQLRNILQEIFGNISL